MKIIKGLFIIVLLALLALGLAYLLLRPKERTNQGHNMSQWLKILGTNTNSTDDPLKIVKITSDDKFGNVEFEVPMAYDLLQQYGFLQNCGKFDLSINGRALSTGCERATNGNCILECGANDFAPGTNQVQVQFFIINPSNKDRSLYAAGPVAKFISTNVCLVNEHIFMDSKGMVILWGDLSISNARYNIELLDTNGDHIKTISGITSNGVINEQWNLIGDSGKGYSPNSIDAVFHIALTNSSTP